MAAYTENQWKRNLRIKIILIVLSTFFTVSLFSIYNYLSFEKKKKLAASDEIANYYDFGDTISGNYLSARFASKNHQFDLATNYYTKSLKHDSNNDVLNQRSFVFLLLSGNIEEAVAFTTKYHKENNLPFSSLDNIVLAISDIKEGYYRDAEDRVFTIIETEGDRLSNTDLMLCSLIIMWSKAGQGAIDEAGGLIASLGDIEEFVPVWSHHLAMLNEYAGKNEEADMAYSRSTTGSYMFAKNAGEFYEKNNLIEEAVRIYSRYQQLNESKVFNNRIRNLQNDVSYEHKDINVERGINNALIEVVNYLHDQELYQEALVYLQLAAYLDPELEQVNYLMGVNYKNIGLYSKSNELLSIVSKYSNMYYNANIYMSANSIAVGNGASVKDKLDDLISFDKNRVEAYFMLAEIMNNEGGYNDAIDLYNQAYQLKDLTSQSKWLILYKRAISHDDSGNWKNAEQDLLNGLEIDPNNPDIMNYIGYSWIEKNKNLSVATEMIKSALDLRPHDPNIMDSFGWVMMKNGNFEQAKLYLEQAVELKPDDATLRNHLGDLYWQIGRTIEAKFQWNYALTFDIEANKVADVKDKIVHGIEIIPANNNQSYSSSGF